MALVTVISGVTSNVAGTAVEYAHSLGQSPDFVVITPVGYSGFHRYSGTIFLSSTGVNASVVPIAATYTSMMFKAVAVKWHSIFR